MAKEIPTRLGDVLILHTAQAFTVYVVGQVSEDGQQDFYGQTVAKYVDNRVAAVAAAKALAESGRRIFLRNIDTDDWSEIPSGVAKGNP